MFIRESKTKNKKNGKVYIKHRLVESVRTERGPRQRSVMPLGKLTLDRGLWKELALALELYLHGEKDLISGLSLYELPAELLEEITRQRAIIRHHQGQKSQISDSTAQGSDAKQIQAIDVDSFEIKESRSLGAELVANDAWKQLGFEGILVDCGFSNKEIALAAAVIWGRLIQPGSDLATWRWLRENSSLVDFFEADIRKVHKDRIYTIADKLLAHKAKLEEALYQRQCEIFNYQKTLFLFDLTNFYFEGKAEGNELAARGKSKEKRNQNPLVSLALIVDEHGFPVKSEVFEGNVGEPATLEKILKSCGLLDTKEGELPLRPMLAMDRGIATEENIEFLKRHNFPFVVIERANRVSKFSEEFDEMSGFKQIKDSKGQIIHLKKIGDHVLCRSEAREEKEKAMRTKKLTRTQAELDAMAKSIATRRLKGTDKIHERLGRIKANCAGFDKLFEINISADNKSMAYVVKPENKNYPGCYVILKDGVNGNEEHIWRTYTLLTHVEGAFCSMKTDLGTRPVYHQGAERTKAHLFLSILAYHMLANIEHRLLLKKSPQKWHKIRLSLQNHRRSTLFWKDEQGCAWLKTLSSTPEPVHMDIYRKLNIKNPLKNQLFSGNVVPKKTRCVDSQ